MKKNKSFYTRTIKPFIKDNRVLLTAVAGAATGIIVTGGGEYITDWKPGSSFGWKGINGQMLTYGTVLEVQQEN